MSSTSGPVASPPNQPGTTLEQVADPDVVVRHVPQVCGGCGDGLAGAAEVAVTRRQVFDIPEPAVVVTEHQIVTVACGCGHRTSGAAPAEATAPVAYGPRRAGIGVYLLHGQFLSIGRTADALRDLFGLPVAAATVSCWVKRTALGIIEKVLPVIADRIAAAPVAHFDETGMRADGQAAVLPGRAAGGGHARGGGTDADRSAVAGRGALAVLRPRQVRRATRELRGPLG